MLNKDRLRGKVAVVTGSGSGIGQGIALMFARQDATVVAADVDPTSAAATVALAEGEGLSMNVVYPLDLAAPMATDRLEAEAAALHGVILVNAAAFCTFAWREEMRYEDWKRTLIRELDLVFLACKAAWPRLIKRGAVRSSISRR